MTVTRNQLVLAGAAAALVLGLLLLWPARQESVEEQIRNTLLQMREAAQKRDVGGLVEKIAEDFRTDEGLDKQAIRGVLVAQILRGQWVRVFEIDLRITPTSQSSGEVSGTWLFARSDTDDLSKLAAESVVGSYQIDARLERRGEDWRVTWARYQPADPFSGR